MKIRLFYLLAFSQTLFLYSQTIKTYSGVFEEGTATYQYYENENFERVFHGKFNYKTNTINTIGSFRDNKKNGLWIVNKKEYNYILSTDILETVTANYNLGKLNGTVLYKKVDSKTLKTIARSNAVFNDNVITEKMEYIASGDENNFSIQFNFDENGLFNGSNIVKYFKNNNAIEDKSKYEHGVLISRIHRNLSNGEIYNRINRINFAKDFIKNINDSTNSSFVSNFFVKKEDQDLIYKLSEYVQLSKYYKFEYDSLDFKNIWFKTIIDQFLYDYDSYTGVNNKIEFWQNNDGVGFSNSNPLFYFNKGTDIISFKPILSFDVDKNKMYNISKDKSLKKRKVFLESLIVALKNQIEWVKIDTIIESSSKSYYISYLPITVKIEASISLYNNLFDYNFPQRYSFDDIKNNEGFITLNKIIKDEKFDSGNDIRRFENAKTFVTEYQRDEIASLLELKIADHKSVEIAKNKISINFEEYTKCIENNTGSGRFNSSPKYIYYFVK